MTGELSENVSILLDTLLISDYGEVPYPFEEEMYNILSKQHSKSDATHADADVIEENIISSSST